MLLICGDCVIQQLQHILAQDLRSESTILWCAVQFCVESLTFSWSPARLGYMINIGKMRMVLVFEAIAY